MTTVEVGGERVEKKSRKGAGKEKGKVIEVESRSTGGAAEPVADLRSPSVDTGLISLPGVVLGKVGMEITQFMDFEKWESIGKTLRRVQGCVMWWIGDWVRWGEAQYGEKYSQALDETDYAYGTIANSVWVCGQIEASRRREELSFGHHQEVAKLEAGLQNSWLKMAVDEKWSVKDLRAAMKGKVKEEEQECICPKCSAKHKVPKKEF